MIKENQLIQQILRLKYTNTAGDFSLADVQHGLAVRASNAQIPVAFGSDQLKLGGLFGSTEPCLVMYHPDHAKDYYYYVFKVDRQAAFAFLTGYSAGKSALFDKGAQHEQDVVNLFSNNGKSEVMAGIARKGLKLFGGDREQRKQAERDYYSLIRTEVLDKL